MRVDGREAADLRPVTITPGYIAYPEGSVLIAMGETRVLCNVTIEEKVPNWVRTQKLSIGWVTAEYAMLPRATSQRTPRETSGLRGRTQEVRRMIGRSLRAAVDLELLGARTCILDCDVIQADGGTRTAAITGGFVALALALRKLNQAGVVPENVLTAQIAAVSVGLVAGTPMLDLCYQEDAVAQVDANVVMNAGGEFVEVQATAEGKAFSRLGIGELLDLAEAGIGQLLSIQSAALQTL